MTTEKPEPSQGKNRPASLLLELALSPCDEVAEVDMINDCVRIIRHAENKYFSSGPEMSFEATFRQYAEKLIHPEDREIFLASNDLNKIRRRLEDKKDPGVTYTRFRIKLLDGGWRWAEQVLIFGELNGVPHGILYAFLFDIETQEAPGERMPDHGGHIFRNALTGLLTEGEFFSRGNEMIGELEHPEAWCVIAMDLEQFKLFNEWYGRDQGDQLLAQIGARLLREEMAMDGVACYFGQDDFGLLTPYDEEELDCLYADIHGLIKGYGTSVGFMPAFGVSMLDGKSTLEEILDRASMASRHAKENYHTRIRMFESSMYRQTERDYQILSDFQEALKNHELFIQLQPQCQIASRKVVGAESLVRWRKADGTLVSPGVFVPVLERYGFVTDLDKYVWEEVCAWQKKWIDGGHTPLPISVNVSQIDIYTIDVPDYFDQLIEKYDLPVAVIKIEITESAYVDNDSVADTVKRLREKGFLVLMDDFGSGYSSLNMLRNLSVDIIKLDAQFLRMSGDDRKGVQIMETIVNMAKTMGVPIIVEGVETREETDFLAGLGCTYVQGYYFYHPMPVEEFEALIEDLEHIDTRGFLFRVKEQFHTREFLDENVFSDTVLNNILGPVAFYLWHGDDVDITRFNQQFYQEIKTPELYKYTKSIQRMLAEGEEKAFYSLLRQAVADPLNGAIGSLRFMRPDGSCVETQLQLFFLGEDESGKRFYGSTHDVTQINRINGQMRRLAKVSPVSIVFLRRSSERWDVQTVFYGLGALGLTQEAFERELADGDFFRRIGGEDRSLLQDAVEGPGMQLKEAYRSFRVVGEDGRQLTMNVAIDDVRDKDCDADYLLVFHLRT